MIITVRWLRPSLRINHRTFRIVLLSAVTVTPSFRRSQPEGQSKQFTGKPLAEQSRAAFSFSLLSLRGGRSEGQACRKEKKKRHTLSARPSPNPRPLGKGL